MAVSKQQKVEIQEALVAKFKEAQSIGFAATDTMTVEEFSELRTNLREVNATYTLAKKTLIKRALKEALDIEIDLKDFVGQVGFVCSNDDAIAGLGKVNDFGKKTKWAKINWVASVFEWELKDLEETKIIASMPSRETLLSRLVWSMMSPLSGMARFLDAASKELETTGKTKVGELEGEAKEEVKEEKAPEAPAAEVKAEETKEA